MTLLDKPIDEVCINTMRMLSIDAVQQAKSGHPGMPLGAAPMAYVLWTRFLRHNPSNSLWPNRDRYVHSAGHGSALLYSLLYLTGHDLSLDEIKRFRQWQSKTPGHPELDRSTGIESTTGPLGQGFGMGVGMALAERYLAADFNRPGFPIVDHYTYGIVSDGDLMEGVSSEAASLAGHLRLGKLIYLYDDNHISIEGDTALAFTEDVAARFKAYDWHVQRVPDANDLSTVDAAIRNARAETERPSLILVRSHIGYGSPKQDKASAHGEPLGEEALKATKEFLGWPLEPRFFVPENALSHFRQAVAQGQEWEQQWQNMLSDYRLKFPAEAERFHRQMQGELPADWDADVPSFSPQDGSMATRVASGKALNAIAKRVPALIGGSADLAPSTNTLISGSDDQSFENPAGRNIRFGVREHGMGTIVNGMALHGGVVPYGATFLIFSDYMRASIRLAALMGVHSTFIFTHDSIGLGEDGPTHQPVEHLASLRAIPNLTVIRPADANETAQAWRVAMRRPGPVALILTRQKLPVFDRQQYNSASGLVQGAYILSDADGKPDILLIATGSEVALALETQKKLLSEKGIKSRVVSMPSWEIFSEQSREYRDRVLPPDLPLRLAIEAASPLGWKQWVGDRGDVVCVDRFGASAPGDEVMSHYGFNVDNVVACAEALTKGTR
ncbi:MAG TPA: transketolase [Desulfomonilaceae bacterium]|nr:transketolase [Desulfomonilaceae bacterium]